MLVGCAWGEGRGLQGGGGAWPIKGGDQKDTTITHNDSVNTQIPEAHRTKEGSEISILNLCQMGKGGGRTEWR